MDAPIPPAIPALSVRSECRLCNAGIRWAEIQDGTRIPLDLHEEMRGEDRFRVDDRGMAHPVPADLDTLAYKDHRVSCPYWRVSKIR